MNASLLDLAKFVLDPANSDPGTLIAVVCVLVGASGLAVVWVLRRHPRKRRPTVEELANPDYNPHLDGPHRHTRRPR